MRLLEADLKNNGVYPGWFNAWHYQKEDHLLAYLLEAIRKQAVPRLHTLQGLRLRARLLGLRATRRRWTLATLVIVLAFCAGLLRHPEATAELTEWLGNWRKWTSASRGQLTILGISVGTAFLFVTGLSFWVLARRPNEIIQDSKKFTDALQIWRPVIGEQHKTPREISCS